MRALLIDDESEREQIKDVRKSLKKLHVELLVECELLGRIGINTFKKRISGIDVPLALAIVDYKLGWKDIEDAEWNGDAVANYVRAHWPNHPIHTIFVSAYLRGAESRYDILRDLVQTPLCAYVEFTGDWVAKFEAQVLSAYAAVGYQPPTYLSVEDRPLVEAFREAARVATGSKLIGESSRFPRSRP